MALKIWFIWNLIFIIFIFDLNNFKIFFHEWVKVKEKMSMVIFLSFQTDRYWQTVQTQIRLLLEEQSDQGLHCLQFPLHFWTHYSKETPSCSTFRVITTNFLGVRIFRKFTVGGVEWSLIAPVLLEHCVALHIPYLHTYQCFSWEGERQAYPGELGHFVKFGA